MTDPAFIAARIRRWETPDPPGPTTVEIYPTLRCNLNCKFCDATNRNHPHTPEVREARLLEWVDEAAEMGVRRLFVLGGGEPLVAPGIAAFLARAKARDLEGILSTNGTLLSSAMADLLVGMGWDEVHVSVDAPTAAIHDHLRGVPGSHRRAVQGACRLRRTRDLAGSRKPRLALHFVLTRSNWRTLPDMVRLAASLGAFRIDFDALIAWRPEQQALQLLPEEVREVPAVAAEALRIAESEGIATTLAHLLEVRNLGRGTVDGPVAVDPGQGPGVAHVHCLRPWHYLVLDAAGRSSPCCVLSGLGESALDKPLQEVWHTDPFLVRLREEFRAGRPHPRCTECSANILGHERAIRDRLASVP